MVTSMQRWQKSGVKHLTTITSEDLKQKKLDYEVVEDDNDTIKYRSMKQKEC